MKANVYKILSQSDKGHSVIVGKMKTGMAASSSELRAGIQCRDVLSFPLLYNKHLKDILTGLAATWGSTYTPGF